VLFRHVLKNGLLPVIALVGLDIGVFMGGIVIVESVFGWPGIGQMVWQAIQLVDVPVIMGGVLITALFVVLGNLLADLIYPLLDPRIQYG
jgi:peptide/nickel transport system permease protein